MKTVTLTRIESSDQGTFSELRFGSSRVHASELPWRDNEPRKSCIPTGEYACSIRWSPKHSMNVYGVDNVAGRSDIEIHPANFGGDVDKGYQAELLGCIAPCMFLGYLLNTHGNPQRAGLSSREAFDALMAWADNEPFTLIITQELA